MSLSHIKKGEACLICTFLFGLDLFMTGDLVNAKLVLIVNRFLAHTLLVYSPSPFMSSMAYFIRKVLRVIWSKTNPAFRVSAAQKIIGNMLLHQKLF